MDHHSNLPHKGEENMVVFQCYTPTNDSDGQDKEEFVLQQLSNMHDLYATIRNLSGKYSKPERPVKDKDGQSKSDLEEQKRRWVEHFEELLNRPAHSDPLNIQPGDSDLPID